MAHIDTVIVFTGRMRNLAAFYQEALGLGDADNDGPGHVGWHLGDAYFGIDQVDVAGTIEEQLRGASIWFAVDDLDATFRRCVEAGATVRYPPTLKPMGDVLASLHDPEGNLFGLVER